MLTEMRTISLPAELCKRAEQKWADRFGSLEEMLELVLSDLLRDDEMRAEEQEEHIIEQRLKDLGYL